MKIDCSIFIIAITIIVFDDDTVSLLKV